MSDSSRARQRPNAAVRQSRKLDAIRQWRPLQNTSGYYMDTDGAIRRLSPKVDRAERQNIARTKAEIEASEPIEMPTQTIEGWENDLRA